MSTILSIWPEWFHVSQARSANAPSRYHPETVPSDSTPVVVTHRLPHALPRMALVTSPAIFVLGEFYGLGGDVTPLEVTAWCYYPDPAPADSQTS